MVIIFNMHIVKIFIFIFVQIFPLYWYWDQLWIYKDLNLEVIESAVSRLFSVACSASAW